MTTTPQPLFRPMAVAAQGSQWAGSIVLVHPVPMRLAASVAAVITLALALLLTFGEYTRKVRVSGQIVPVAGSLRVVAPQFGRITARLVDDGARVVPGQPLFELTSERATGNGGVETRINALFATRHAERAQASRLQTAELRQRAQALLQRRRSIEAEIASRKQQVILQEAQIANAREKLKRYTKLAKQGYISPSQLNDVAAELTGQLAQREALQSNILSTQRDLLAVREEGQGIAGKIELAASQARQELAALEQEAAEHDGRRGIRILAPAAGTVTALALEPGQSVQAGTALATVIPAGAQLEARLLVPSRAVGFIEPGQQVLLRLDPFAYQKFGPVAGTVVRVDGSPISEEQGAGASPLYRVTVRLSQQSVTAYGKKQLFKAGMTLEADILQDRRRLIEWMLDPFISAAKGRAG